MKYTESTPKPEIIYLEPGAEDYALTQRILDSLPDVPVVREASSRQVTAEIAEGASDIFGTAKNRWVLAPFQGPFLKKCPGISPGMVCCNYYVVNLIKNCVYDCSYCFLQDFLENNPLLTAFVNVEDLIAELQEEFRIHPDRTFRVGTGELTDSLALDHLIPHTELLIPFFNRQSNAVLELKTKSDQIENLLKHDPTNVIVSWSINPQEIADREEKGTPSIARRLEAARLCQEKGYRVGFHFDPVIIFPGWEQAYESLIDTLFDTVAQEGIEWISLGSFRYRPNLRRIMKDRHSGTRLLTGEHVAGADGKYRYLRPLRNHA